MVWKKCVICGNEFKTTSRKEVCSDNCWKERYKIHRKKQYWKNKDKILIQNKEYVRKNRDKARKWGRKHSKKAYKKKLINRSDEELKQQNANKLFKYHNSELIKHRARIRELTSKRYGKAVICSKCGSTDSVQHHHTTNPYRINKFIDLCNICHGKIHRK